LQFLQAYFQICFLSNNLLDAFNVFITKKKNLSVLTFVGNKYMYFLKIPLIVNDRKKLVFEQRDLICNIYFTNEYYIYRNK
jgi:hypothetical protein